MPASSKQINDLLAAQTSDSIFMMTDIAHAIGGAYKQLVLLKDYVPGALAEPATTISVTPTLLGVFATNAGDLNTSNISAGNFLMHYETWKAAGSNNYYSYFELYTRKGLVETLIGTSDNTSESASNNKIQSTVTLFKTTDVNIATVDFLVVKIYGVMLSATASVKLRYEDNTTSRFEKPIYN
jgi:hypothetical protein